MSTKWPAHIFCHQVHHSYTTKTKDFLGLLNGRISFHLLWVVTTDQPCLFSLFFIYLFIFCLSCGLIFYVMFAKFWHTWFTALYTHFTESEMSLCRTQWLRGLRRGSAATRLMVSQVSFSTVTWISVCCQADISASVWSLVQSCPIECDCEASIMRGPWPTRGCWTMEKINFVRSSVF